MDRGIEGEKDIVGEPGRRLRSPVKLNQRNQSGSGVR